MIEDPEELAALQRLALMFVPESERAAFWRECMKLSAAHEFRATTPTPNADDLLQ